LCDTLLVLARRLYARHIWCTPDTKQCSLSIESTQGYGGSLRHWRALYLMPSNVFKLLTAWVSVLSSQFSVASCQFSVSQLRRFRRLFALRNQGRSRRRRYPGMVGFFARIRCAHSF